MWPLRKKPTATGGTIYLAKANDDFISFCRCKEALVSFPSQMDCPWCGCGWLFSCIECRKAFTFAKAVIVPRTLEELGRVDSRRRSKKEPDADSLCEVVDAMRSMLTVVEVGKTYVYFDGMYVSIHATGIKLNGWHAHHNLKFVPQVEAMRDPTVRDAILSNPEYWETWKNLEAV